MTDDATEHRRSHAGRFAPHLPDKPADSDRDTAREPNGPVEWSRRALLNVVNALGAHASAVTLVGGHAVHIRTAALDVTMLPTSDADLAVTPALVSDSPSIGALLEAAGYVNRIASRPGMWGRGDFASATGTRQFREQIDLTVPLALSGAAHAGKRSTPVLAQRHGKMSTTNAAGLELATVNGDYIEVRDFANPSLTREIRVAGIPALLVAKAQKVSERMDDRRPGRLKEKDLGDIWRLLASVTPDECMRVIESHLPDAAIGTAVSIGLAHLRRVLRDPLSNRLASATLHGSVPDERVAGDFQRWAEALG